MTPDAYCQEKAARGGSSFYYSFLFLAPEQRRAITALYAFCREVDDVVDECTDPGTARLKLDWWRSEVERIFQGTPEHPVGRALGPAVSTYRLERERLLDVIRGMEMDLTQPRYATYRDLQVYCRLVAGVVGEMAAEIFGYRNPGTLDYARELGLALQLTNILRDVREDATRGRVYIPEDELARFEVTPDMLGRSETTAAVRALFEHQAQRAYACYERALALLPREDRFAQRSGIAMAAIYRATLDEIRLDGYRVLAHRVSLTPLRKFWIAWRTARAEKRLSVARDVAR